MGGVEWKYIQDSGPVGRQARAEEEGPELGSRATGSRKGKATSYKANGILRASRWSEKTAQASPAP